jgi:stage II sporulation SpoE-like protein
MAGRAHAIARRARLARRGMLVAALAGGVLGLQSLPTAAAAKDPAASTSPAASETTASTRRAERAAAKAEAAQPPAAVESSPAEASPPPALHGHRGQPAAHAPVAPPPGAAPGMGTGAAPASRGADRPISAARARRREERQAEQTTTAASTETPDASASEGSSAANAQELAHGQKKAKKEKEKEKTKAKGKEGHKEKGKKTSTPPGEEPTEESSSGATVTGKGASDSAETAQPTALAASVAASAVALAATPAGGTSAASIDSLAASVKAQPGSGAAGARATRAAHLAGKQKRAAGTLAAAAAPFVSSQASAAPATAAHPAHALAKRAQKSSSQPAIVNTITRIVGVVPTPVRILILVLVALALALAARSIFSGVRTRRLVRQRGELLEDVGALQAALLPVPPQRLGPVGTSVSYRPADGPGAGGDFYDVFALEDGRIGVIVGDVSGHGREALPHTALVRFTVRAYLEAGLEPAKALQTAGNVLERQLAGSFATVVVAIYHPRERTLTYASAGHPPPVVLGEPAAAAAALVPVTSCSAPPVGAGTRTGTRQTVVSVPGPARLCFHTDGVTEARIGGELFGGERLTELLAELDVDADASALLDRVTEHSDARPDDMAACLLHVHDGAGGPSIVFEQLELDSDAAANPRAERFLLDCGVPAAEAALLMRGARARLEHAETVLIELRLDGGEPVVSLHDDNVIHPQALAAASAS